MVWTWSAEERKARLLRIMWDDDRQFLSIGWWPKLFQWRRQNYEWRFTLLGLTLHWRYGFGGRFG
jgi:hypothetical protein